MSGMWYDAGNALCTETGFSTGIRLSSIVSNRASGRGILCISDTVSEMVPYRQPTGELSVADLRTCVSGEMDMDENLSRCCQNEPTSGYPCPERDNTETLLRRKREKKC